MAATEQSGSGVWLPAVVTFGAALWATLGGELPLDTTRQNSDIPILEDSDHSQPVRARLWQDPLLAAETWKASSKARGKSAPPSAVTPLNPGKTVTVLPVFVQGAPFPEQAQRRLKSRYAVVSALTQSGFRPAGADRLGLIEYVRRPRPTILDRLVTALPFWCPARDVLNARLRRTITFHVPFEWWTNPGRDVLVIWLNQNFFDESPLSDLANLLGSMTSFDDPACVTVSIIGPTNSGVLIKMLRQRRFWSKDVLWRFGLAAGSGARRWRGNRLSLERARLYSPWATMSDRDLRESLGGKKPEGGRPAAGRGLRLMRSIGSDDALAGKIEAELSYREVTLSKARIALIHEADTDYAVKLAGLLADAEEDRAIDRFGYLRGLDGSRAGGGLPAKGSAATAKGERSEGETQVDYLRRLARRLERSGVRYRAIGILGSDFHDKLLVLKAIRPVFPDALFFTTDLDARYFDRAVVPFTRNVVVVSHFGLSLCPRHYQDRVSPFRDSYQTATFLATLQGLGAAHWREPPAPEVFEIARYGAYNLATDPPCADGQRLADCRVHGPSTRALMGRNAFLYRVLFSAAILGLLIWNAIVHVGTFRSLGPRVGWKLWFLSWQPWALLAGLSLICICISDHLDPYGEPFSLVGGISTWPVSLIWLGSGILVWKLIREFLGESRDELGESEAASDAINRWALIEAGVVLCAGAFAYALFTARPGLSDTGLVLWAVIFFGGSLFSVWTARRRVGSLVSVARWAREEAPSTPERVWEDYLRLSRPDMRFLRVMVHVPLLAALYFLVFELSGGRLPLHRGVTSHVVDVFSFFVGLLSLTVVLMLTFDSTRLMRTLIKRLDRAAGEGEAAGSLQAVTCQVERFERVEDLSRPVAKLIYAPALVAVFLFVSRGKAFDHWTWPDNLLLCIIAVAILIVASGLSLWRTANRVRQRLAQRIERAGRNDKKFGPLHKRVAELQDGAFAAFWSNPVLRALLIPFGGIGTLEVIRLFATNA